MQLTCHSSASLLCCKCEVRLRQPDWDVVAGLGASNTATIKVSVPVRRGETWRKTLARRDVVMELWNRNLFWPPGAAFRGAAGITSSGDLVVDGERLRREEAGSAAPLACLF
jgi:hypothetical protein